MDILLDTQAFLWFNADDRRLSARARDLVSDAHNRVLVSAVVSWEIAIKYARGRMPELTEPPESFVVSRMSIFGFEPLSIDLAHTFRVAGLPHHHRDSFDRLLVAQAQVEGLPIVTSDPDIARYDVEVIW